MASGAASPVASWRLGSSPAWTSAARFRAPIPAWARSIPSRTCPASRVSRRCLFEIVRGLQRLKPGAALDRSGDWAEGRAGASGVTAPVRFYTPKAFAAPFLPYFAVESVRALPLWLPPVHLYELYRDDP